MRALWLLSICLKSTSYVSLSVERLCRLHRTVLLLVAVSICCSIFSPFSVTTKGPCISTNYFSSNRVLVLV